MTTNVDALYQAAQAAQARLDSLRASSSSDYAIDIAEQEFWAAQHAYEAASADESSVIDDGADLCTIVDPRITARPGRPALDDSSPTVMVSVRMTERQRSAFKFLGGSEWLRDRIDDALRSAGALRDSA